VLSYNIHGLRDDASAVSDVIRSCDVDVALIQEAPRFLRWRSKRAAIARQAGLVVATANRPAGLVILTSLRADVVSTHFTLLPKSPRLHQRAVDAAVLEIAGARWTFVSTHLSLDQDERVAHLAPLWDALPANAPLVIGADVNELPDGPVWGELSSRLTDAWSAAGSGTGHTFSATAAHKRIDGIFVSDDVEVVSCRAVDDAPGVERASDHLPVVAELRYPRR
jgi:endonuclease/exonuclease/phosphatase family metal-dependent hydrolase